MNTRIMRFYYSLALTAIAVAIGLSQMYVHYLNKKREDDYRVINLAGRQRMLSQKISKSLILVATKASTAEESNLYQDFKLWTTTHESLYKGNKELRLPIESDDHFIRRYKRMDEQVSFISSSVDLVREDKLDLVDLQLVQKESLSFLQLMNDTVFAYEKRSEDNLKQIQLIDFSLFMFIVLIIIAIGYFIFRPMAKAVERYSKNQDRLTSKLKREALRANEAAKVKELFLANMSHEVKTPLNGVIGSLELISEKSINKSDRKHLLNAKKGGQHLYALIKSLLNFSKLQNGSDAVSCNTIDLSDIKSYCIASLAPTARSKGIEFDFQLKADSKTQIYFDEVKLIQIIFNLTSNAIKFTEKGKVNVSLSANHHSFTVAVKDTGPGIPKEYQSSIFESFNQVGEDSIKKSEGTGLGLAIVKEIVDLFGGQISLTSELGVGSLFTVTIPVKEPPQAKGSLKTSKQQDLVGLSVLIVDDNPTNLVIAKTLAEKLNATVFTATNGEEALKTFEEHNTDLVLMDCQMPILDGFEATKRLRKIYGQKPKIFALTAAEMLAESSWQEHGFDGFIAKPFRKSDLLTALGSNEEKSTAA